MYFWSLRIGWRRHVKDTPYAQSMHRTTFCWSSKPELPRTPRTKVMNFQNRTNFEILKKKKKITSPTENQNRLNFFSGQSFEKKSEGTKIWKFENSPKRYFWSLRATRRRQCQNQPFTSSIHRSMLRCNHQHELPRRSRTAVTIFQNQMKFWNFEKSQKSYFSTLRDGRSGKAQESPWTSSMHRTTYRWPS
jgi:hypothetical protein